MNLRSLNFAIELYMTAVALRTSPHKFSSLAAVSRTVVPSATWPSATTVNVVDNALLQRQCDGRAEHTTFGLPVRTRSPGLWLTNALSARSPANMSDIGGQQTRWPPPTHFRFAVSPPSLDHVTWLYSHVLLRCIIHFRRPVYRVECCTWNAIRSAVARMINPQSPDHTILTQA